MTWAESCGVTASPATEYRPVSENATAVPKAGAPAFATGHRIQINEIY